MFIKLHRLWNIIERWMPLYALVDVITKHIVLVTHIEKLVFEQEEEQFDKHQV